MRSIISLNRPEQNQKISLAIFLEFVEIKTKLASLFPMLAGFLWTYYRYREFGFLQSLIYFFAVILFDMTTTAINNTMDYYKAIDQNYKYQENLMGRYRLDEKKILTILSSLLGGAVLFSIFLVFLTDPVILFIGAICFLIGITYTFGPLPTSRTPLGEVLSGLTMGFGIFYLAVFVNRYDNLFYSQWGQGQVQVTFDWLQTIQIFIMSLPFVCLIANIMLANNTCDLETDRLNDRYTLVHYLGKKKAVYLYQLLSAIPWFAWLIYILLGIMPKWALVGFIFIYPYYLSVKRFSAQQIKGKTFVEALKSFLIFSVMYCLTLLQAILLA